MAAIRARLEATVWADIAEALFGCAYFCTLTVRAARNNGLEVAVAWGSWVCILYEY